jgi:hypothetical protein
MDRHTSHKRELVSHFPCQPVLFSFLARRVFLREASAFHNNRTKYSNLLQQKYLNMFLLIL